MRRKVFHMNIADLLDTLRSAYEQLDHPQMSGLKTVHQKTAVEAALKAEFDTALSRVDRDGRQSTPKDTRKSNAA
jgi:hypothetical protein